MSRSLRLALALIAVVLVVGNRSQSSSARHILPLSEVRAGQRAVAKSVFRGTKIESFNLEIVGVLRKFDGTRSVILGRVLDGPVVTRKSGVIGGMSGSPVYIKGRLVGAIALAWPWSKEPIAGITPIEEMLEAWEARPPADSKQASSSDARLALPIMVGDTRIDRVRVGAGLASAPDAPGMMTLVPLGGVVQVSGFNDRAARRVADLLEPYGLRVVQGPGGGEERLSPSLVPGAALGVQLMGGDFNMSALATVTLVEGKRVLGFGHPMFQLGPLDIPMTGGYVYDIMPNLFISNKIMAPTQVVGRVWRDHQSAIAGEIGEQADLLPVSVEVMDQEVGRSRSFEIEVVRMRELLPGLVASSVMTAIDETRGRVSRGTAHTQIELEVEGRAALRREEVSYSNSDAAAAAIPAVIAPLAVFTDNPFGQLRLKRVRVRVEAQDERRTASIERVTTMQSRVEAGDQVTLNVALRPYGKSPVSVPVKLNLPRDLPRGRVRVVLSGGVEEEQARASLGSPRPAPVSLEQLVERYVSREGACDLVVQAALTRVGVSLLGEELPDIPRSAVDALRAAHPTDLRPLPSILKVVEPTPWVLTGRQMVTLEVESPLAPSARPMPKPPVEGPPEEGEEEEASASLYPTPLSDGQSVQAAPQWAAVAAGRAAGASREPAARKEPGEEREQKPLTRAPEVWVHQVGGDYAEAELRGVAVREDGRLSLAPSCLDVAGIPADVLWCVVAREDCTYVGTGSAGMVYRVSEAGEVSEFFTTGEMNVHALALDEEGNLYAATSPRGSLFRVAPDGKGELIYDSDATYLWCLAVGPGQRIYAGAGPPARIYEIEPGGKAKCLAELPAANVISLVRIDDGSLYAGTSDAGVVYRVRPDGTASAVCQLPGSAVQALAVAENNTLYASASPGGEVYRISADGLPSLYCATNETTIYGLAVLPEGDLVAATGPRGTLVRCGPDRKPQVVFRPEAGVATAIEAANGTLYVASSAPSVLRKIGPAYPAAGVLESAVLDAERPARWGRVDWAAETPEGTQVRVDTRSGDSPNPEDHWSPWTATADGFISSPPGRYLQYRLILTPTAPAVTPTVQQIRVSYRPQNRPPTCSVREPTAGDRLSKKYALKWQARDPDRDDLVYDVSISSDLGKTWKDLKKDLTEPKYEWDTAKRKDGRYLLRVVASDRRSVPEDPQTGEASLIIWVDNTAPDVMFFRSSVAVADDHRVRATGLASDKLSPIRSVEYRTGDGEWTSLPLASIESSLTDFSIATDPLSPGSHDLQVRAFDAGGNQGTDKVEVTVEEGKPAQDTDSTGEAAEAK